MSINQAKAGSRRSISRFLWKLSPYGFLLPAVLVLLIFYLFPLITAVSFSFMQWNGITPPVFIGIQNYIQLFKDPYFIQSIWVNVRFAIFSLVQLPLALLLAVLLTEKGRGMKFFRTVLFIPQTLSLVAVGVLWLLLYNPTQGPLTRMLHFFGVQGTIDWLGTPANAMMSLVITSTWVYFGFHMVLQIAGIQAIPQDIYDYTKLETNNSLLVFLLVTLPLLRETILISVVMMISGAFTHAIGLVYVLTRGGPLRSTELIPIYMYKQAFNANQFGYANSVAVVIAVFVGLFVGLLVWQFSKDRIEF